ncbi:MAG: hypothetical protein AAF741_13945 [Bacteroidota bacterium]
MKKGKIFRGTISDNRNFLAQILVGASLVGIAFVAFLLYSSSSVRSEKVANTVKIFDTIIPLLATWIGTILAFYFGSKNFEAAANKYAQIINNISPDVLDDVQVGQIMINRKTMVSKSYEEIKNSLLSEIKKFLESVNKSRLPIFDGDKIKYILHASTIDQMLNEAVAESETPKSDKIKTRSLSITDRQFVSFEEKYKNKLTSFLMVKESDILEKVILKIKTQPSVNDVFVQGEDDKTVGWLTDSLIIRYIKSTL